VGEKDSAECEVWSAKEPEPRRKRGIEVPKYPGNTWNMDHRLAFLLRHLDTSLQF